MTIHAEMKQAGIEIYHGECSLVVKDCPTARVILANYGVSSTPSTLNRQSWLELPDVIPGIKDSRFKFKSIGEALAYIPEFYCTECREHCLVTDDDDGQPVSECCDAEVTDEPIFHNEDPLYR